MPRAGHLRAVAKLLQVIPAALRPDLAAETGGHPRWTAALSILGAGPQATIGRRRGQGGVQRRLVLLIEERLGARVPVPPIAEPGRACGVVAARDLGDPAPPVAGDQRHFPLAPTLAYEPDDLQVRPLDGLPGRSITLTQLRRAQVSNQRQG
jgi:hypothetical protein